METSFQPQLFTNREFQDFVEEEINLITQRERNKLEASTHVATTRKDVENTEGHNGHWESHWITLDEEGNRVYAQIYYGPESVTAITADGSIIRQFQLPDGQS